MKRQDPASEQEIRLQFGLLQVIVKELEPRVRDLEMKNADLTRAVNALTTLVSQLSEKSPKKAKKEQTNGSMADGSPEDPAGNSNH